MKILITGARGFLGSRLAAYFKDKYEVWAPSHAEFDFTEEDLTMAALQKFRPDVVLHCGAISDVGVCEKNPELSMKVNVLGTLYLARACNAVGSRLIYCSSDQVYFVNPREGMCEAEFLKPHTEAETLEPLPLYGQHKLMAEKSAMEACPDTIALRLTWMYDYLTDREMANGRRNLLTMVTDAIAAKEQMIFSETDFRGVTDVNEVVRNMELLWTLPAGIYNFGSSNDTSMYGTMLRILQGTDAEHMLTKTQGSTLRNLTMDLDKLEAEGIFFSKSGDNLKKYL